MVNGEIEVVEIKSDKGFLAQNQIRSYVNVVKNGYTLRLFNIKIVSFKWNQFEIREKIIRDPNEIVYNPFWR